MDLAVSNLTPVVNKVIKSKEVNLAVTAMAMHCRFGPVWILQTASGMRFTRIPPIPVDEADWRAALKSANDRASSRPKCFKEPREDLFWREFKGDLGCVGAKRVSQWLESTGRQKGTV